MTPLVCIEVLLFGQTSVSYVSIRLQATSSRGFGESMSKENARINPNQHRIYFQVTPTNILSFSLSKAGMTGVHFIGGGDNYFELVGKEIGDTATLQLDGVSITGMIIFLE